MDHKTLINYAIPDLKENDVHIWHTSLNYNNENLDILNSTLSEDEIYKANRFRFNQDRERYIKTRGFLRVMLGKYLNKEPKELDFTYNKYGKPSLPETRENRIEFNLSHSSNVIIYAFTKTRKLGIDVERIRPVKRVKKIVERFFSEKEKQFYNSCNSKERESTFFKLWTYKEAYTKAKGLGLSLPLNQFDVPISETNKNIKDPYSKIWSWHEINLDPDYAAALAVEGEDCEIKLWDINNRK